MLFITVLLAAGVGCGERRSEIEAREERERAAFCDAVTRAIASSDEAAVHEALANPPPELADSAEVLRAAGPSGIDATSPRVEMATAHVFAFAHARCQVGGGRKLAVPPGTPIEGLTLCGAYRLGPPPEPDEGSGMTLYGDTTSPDPYAGPMIGLLWDPESEGDHRGGGSGRPVTVRGQRGFAVPITVFEETVLPDLGTVIAWTEGGRDIGVYGRGWSLDRADELLAIANGLEEIDTRLQLPATVLPPDFDLVFSGFPSAAELSTAGSLYSVQYRGEGGTVLVSGLRMSEPAFSAFRFFAAGVAQAAVDGRPVLAGTAWPGEGPAVVTWREPDGLVVRIVGLGASLDLVQKVAAATRELTDDEWAAVSEPTRGCATP